MLPLWCLLDILKFMSRGDLERIQLTNRAVNHIISIDFSTTPLRFLGNNRTLWIRMDKSGDLGLGLVKKVYRSPDEYFTTATRQWESHEHFDSLFADLYFYCKHFYSFETMRPFLGKTVRVNATFAPRKGHPLKSDQIAELESISHVWNGRLLRIEDCNLSRQVAIDPFLHNQMLLQCHTLNLFELALDRLRLDQYPHLCALPTFHYGRSLESDEILELVRQKSVYFPQSDTTIVVSPNIPSDIENLTKTVSEKFLASQTPSKFRFILRHYKYFSQIALLPDSDFRVYNNRAGETLQAKRISQLEANHTYHGDIDGDDFVLLFERLH